MSRRITFPLKRVIAGTLIDVPHLAAAFRASGVSGWRADSSLGRSFGRSRSPVSSPRSTMPMQVATVWIFALPIRPSRRRIKQSPSISIHVDCGRGVVPVPSAGWVVRRCRQPAHQIADDVDRFLAVVQRRRAGVVHCSHASRVDRLRSPRLVGALSLLRRPVPRAAEDTGGSLRCGCHRADQHAAGSTIAQPDPDLLADPLAKVQIAASEASRPPANTVCRFGWRQAGEADMDVHRRVAVRDRRHALPSFLPHASG